MFLLQRPTPEEVGYSQMGYSQISLLETCVSNGAVSTCGATSPTPFPPEQSPLPGSRNSPNPLALSPARGYRNIDEFGLDATNRASRLAASGTLARPPAACRLRAGGDSRLCRPEGQTGIFLHCNDPPEANVTADTGVDLAVRLARTGTQLDERRQLRRGRGRRAGSGSGNHSAGAHGGTRIDGPE